MIPVETAPENPREEMVDALEEETLPFWPLDEELPPELLPESDARKRLRRLQASMNIGESLEIASQEGG